MSMACQQLQLVSGLTSLLQTHGAEVAQQDLMLGDCSVLAGFQSKVKVPVLPLTQQRGIDPLKQPGPLAWRQAFLLRNGHKAYV